MIYRIYTERKPNLAEIANKYFEGFTIIEAKGYWQGKPEPSAVIEIIADESSRGTVTQLAYDIKHTNNQQAVLVVEIEGEDYLVANP